MRRMVLVPFCEPCGQQGIEVQAAVTKLVSIDNGPVKEMDFCDSCARYLLTPLLAAYAACEAEPPTPKQRARLAKKATAALEQAHAPGEEAPQAAPVPPQRVEAAQTLPEVQEEEPEPGDVQYLVCPLDGKKVNYLKRAKHAEDHGLKLYDIKWEDPDGILMVFCTAHEECRENKVGFTKTQGVSMHRRNSVQELIAAN